MTSRTFASRFRNFAEYFDGIRACAAAVEAGRKPSRAALKAARIDPDAFYGIQR
ncbi:hypothetical protein [Aureimonas fodinaquatilis]|uniref:hypothetical protein n=1 Tax=Aureimonas fodinaquatilis TaxID=2565783 RepID=UPI00165D48BA|nr:hypothetical protein [Aureimonas fodinaquatilis]